MEENLHKDNLEDFLNKSFDNYSESPSPDMWDKIEADLEVGATLPASSIKGVSASVWMLSGVVALLVLVIIGQQIYFRGEMKEMMTEIKQEMTQDVLKQEKSNSINEVEVKKEEKAIIPTPGFELQETEKEIETKKSPIAFEEEVTNPIETVKTNLEETTLTKDIKFETTSETEQIVENTSTNNEMSPSSVEEPLSKELDETLPLIEDLAHIEKLTLEQLEKPIITKDLALNLKAPKPIKVKKAGIGVATMILATQGEINLKRNLPFNPPNIDNFLPSIEPSVATYTGILTEWDINKKWSFQTGVYYQRHQHTVRQRPFLKRGNGLHPNGGSVGDSKIIDYTYDLGSTAGSIEVDFRVAQETEEDLPLNEVVALELELEETSQYLSFPFLVKRSFGSKRLQFGLKGGLMVNALVDHQIALTNFQSKSPKFRFDVDKSPRTKVRDRQSVSVDYLLAMSIDYQLNENLKLSIEPTYLSNLTKNNQHAFTEYSKTAFGGQVGVVYNF